MKKNNCRIVRVFGFITVILPSLLIAGERNQANSDDQPFRASLLVQSSFDNNVLSDQDDIIESNILTVAPELVFRAGTGTTSYNFIINGEIAKYDGSSEDNYEDAGLSAAANYEFSSRHRLNLLASYNGGHDDRGTGFSQGDGVSILEVDTFNKTDYSAVYSFGRKATAGQIDFSIDGIDINYDPRFFQGEDITLGRDRSQINSSIQFLYTFTPKMAFRANASHRKTKYDIQTGLDSSENSILVGLSWQGTAKITGTALVGYNDRESDNGLSEQRGSDWQIDLTWKPLSYSSVNFTTSKDNQETIGLGNFNVVTRSGISWNHKWKSRFSSNLSMQFQDREYIGTGTTDETLLYQLSMDYQLPNWVNIKLSYTNASRDTNSEISLLNFDREIVSLSFLFII